MRVWNDESNGGGFFLAVIEKDSSAEPEVNPQVKRELTDEEAPVDNEDVPKPISSDTRTILEEQLGQLPEDLWTRGKKVLWSTPKLTKFGPLKGVAEVEEPVFPVDVGARLKWPISDLKRSICVVESLNELLVLLQKNSPI